MRWKENILKECVVKTRDLFANESSWTVVAGWRGFCMPFAFLNIICLARIMIFIVALFTFQFRLIAPRRGYRTNTNYYSIATFSNCRTT